MGTNERRRLRSPARLRIVTAIALASLVPEASAEGPALAPPPDTVRVAGVVLKW